MSLKTGSSKLKEFTSPGEESSGKLLSEPDEGGEEKEIVEAERNVTDMNKYTPRDSSRREVSFDVKAKKTEKPESRMTPKSTPG